MLINVLMLGYNFSVIEEDILYYENFDVNSIITPVNADHLETELKAVAYDRKKTSFLVNGFKTGFILNYRGRKTNILQTSPNLPFRIGSEEILWDKVMKEVKAKCFAGPFKTPPFSNYIQSPIGLVPKDNGKDTQLIFHLSYPRSEKKLSVNANIPKKFCTVVYPEFEQAIQLCKSAGISAFAGKSDMKSAFRHLPMKVSEFRWLIMKARNPIDKQWYFFIDKCLSFGSSVSCTVFQAFSDAVAFVITKRTGQNNVNYLDDFFFAALLKALCDHQVDQFIQFCSEINFPISLEKTFWGATIIVFLGLLIDTVNQVVCIPIEQINKAKLLIGQILSSKNRKATIQQIQRLSGFLNFLCRCVIPGRAFTTRLYALPSPHLKQHHHVKIPQDVWADLKMWEEFLKAPQVYCRPFEEFFEWNAEDIQLFSDASGNLLELGFGATCQNDWMIGKWSDGLIRTKEITDWSPSIQYLELFAVTAAVLTWIERFPNKKIWLFCDNKSAVDMINQSSSRCKNGMVLIRLIVLQGMKYNTRIFAKHLRSEDNVLSDSLSRFDMSRFWNKAGPEMHKTETSIPDRNMANQ